MGKVSADNLELMKKQCWDSFSADITENQREAIVRYGLIDDCFSRDCEFAVSNLGDAFRSHKYFPELYDDFDKSIKGADSLLSEFRRFFREFGEDVSVSDIFSSEAWQKAVELVRSGQRLSDELIHSELGNEFCTKYENKPDPDGLPETPSGMEHLPMPDEMFLPTVKGQILQCLFSSGLMHRKADIYHRELRSLSRPLHMTAFFQPKVSYRRIIQEYYDRFWEFLSPPGDELEKMRSELDKRHIFPKKQYFPIDDCEYDRFVAELLAKTSVTLEQIVTIERYYKKHEIEFFDKCLPYLTLWPFILTMKLRKEHRRIYRIYRAKVRTDISFLSELSKELHTACFIAHDIKSQIDSNLIFAWVFYDYIFGGDGKLRRKLGHEDLTDVCLNNICVYLTDILANGDLNRELQIYEYGTPSEATTDSAYAKQEFVGFSDYSKESARLEDYKQIHNNYHTHQRLTTRTRKPLSVTRTYCELLMLRNIPSLRSRYGRQRAKFDPSVFESLRPDPKTMKEIETAWKNKNR